MVPTVLGAWIGVATGFAQAMSPGIGLVVFLVGAFGFMYAIEKTKNSAAGVPVLLAFTFFMGLMLSRLVGSVLGLANGAGLVMTAFAGTGAVFFGMATLSSLIKRDLTSMGKWLFIGAMMLLVAGIANVFIQSSALMVTLAVLAVGIFSAFILYDLKRVQGRSRDQLHHRHARRLPEPVQRVPVAAGPARDRRQLGRVIPQG